MSYVSISKGNTSSETLNGGTDQQLWKFLNTFSAGSISLSFVLVQVSGIQFLMSLQDMTNPQIFWKDTMVWCVSDQIAPCYHMSCHLLIGFYVLSNHFWTTCRCLYQQKESEFSEVIYEIYHSISCFSYVSPDLRLPQLQQFFPQNLYQV